MLEHIVLGLVQGVVEWLPISSEGAVILTKSTFFPGGESLGELVRLALFLHLGTFFAALVYFRKDVAKLFAKIARPREKDETQKVLVFLVISTILSGALGFAVLQFTEQFEDAFRAGSRAVNLLIALMLLITAYLQLRSKREGLRKENDLATADGVVLGIAQGAAVVPGLSRSGLTVSALLLRGFDDGSALKLSFLMSLPIVLFGNIILNASMFAEGISASGFAALAASFIAGIATIDALLRLAKKINFGYFTLGFAFLVVVSIFI